MTDTIMIGNTAGNLSDISVFQYITPKSFRPHNKIKKHESTEVVLATAQGVQIQTEFWLYLTILLAMLLTVQVSCTMDKLGKTQNPMVIWRHNIEWEWF